MHILFKQFLLLLASGLSLAYDEFDFDTLENHIHPPHSSILTDIQTDERLLVSGAPGAPHWTVKAAFQLPQLSLFEPMTMQLLQEIKHGIRYAFQTNNTHSLALSGTGITAIETVIDNMVEEGDTFLIPIYGMWSNRVRNISLRLGAKVVTIEKDIGKTFNIEELEAAVIEHKPKLIYLVGGETTTGVFTRLDQIGELCHKHGCYTICDVAHVVGIQPLFMDKWKIDVVYSNVQKGLGSPVGVSLISFSDRAVDKIMKRVKDNRSYHWDLRVWREHNYWLINPSVPHLYLHSYPILLFYTLREGLNRLGKEGLVSSWKRHHDVDKYFRERLMTEFPQLEYFVDDHRIRLTGALFVKLPPNVNALDVGNYLLRKYKVDISRGLGPTWGKVLRISFVGAGADQTVAERTLMSLRETLVHFNLTHVPYKVEFDKYRNK